MALLSHAQLLPTKLEVTVRDGNGNIVQGAAVTLYLTQSDYEFSENAFQTEQTDEKGRIIFKNLSPRSYFLDARKGEMNNDGRGIQTSKLIEKKKNKLTVIIE